MLEKIKIDYMLKDLKIFYKGQSTNVPKKYGRKKRERAAVHFVTFENDPFAGYRVIDQF